MVSIRTPACKVMMEQPWMLSEFIKDRHVKKLSPVKLLICKDNTAEVPSSEQNSCTSNTITEGKITL
jgi:hypothetical protein